ncbi:MAG: hypothetical protein KatS3mg122_3326 [Caldimonas sp.]|nr:MAG: hypothetical protein KatS3mg122_3326 [Caldimonas sp.]
MMMNHPLEATLARMRALNAYRKAELGAPLGAGWIAHTDLAPGAAWLEALIAATHARLRTRAAAIVGSALLQSYQWPLISTAIACYLLDRRVPDLSPANTRIHYTAEHEADTLALLGGRFTTLPDDPAAEHQDATVVTDLAALRAAVRIGIEAHLGVVIDHLCARLGCKPRGLWLNVTDALAGNLVWVAQERDPATSLAALEGELDALICVPGSPLTSRKIGLIQLHHKQRSLIFPDRVTCCYSYKTDGGEYCSTCPHRTLEDRCERLLAYIAEEQAQQHGATQEEVTA